MSGVADYTDIANLSWDNIQAPQNIPGGTYLLRLKNVVFQPSKEEGKNPVVMFVHSPKEPMEDVDSEQLEKLGSDYDISQNKLFTRIFIEDGTSWDQVRRLLEKHGLEMKGGVEESLKAASKANATVLGYVGLGKPFKDRTSGELRQLNEVTEFAKVD